MIASIPLSYEPRASEHGMYQTVVPGSGWVSGMLSSDTTPAAPLDAYLDVIVKLSVWFPAFAPCVSHQYQVYASYRRKAGASKEGFVKNADTPLHSLEGLAVMISLLPLGPFVGS